MHDHYKSNTANVEHIKKQLNNLIKVSAHQIQTQIKIESSDGEDRNGNIRLKYKVSKYKGEDQDFEFYLSAHQILTQGIVMPYYGASFIKLNGSTSGKHITPMGSCNISMFA